MLSSWCAHRCIQAAARHTMPAPLQPRPALSGCTQLASPPRWRCCVLVQAAHKVCVREKRCEISAHGPVAGDGACALGPWPLPVPWGRVKYSSVFAPAHEIIKESTHCEVSPRKWRFLKKQNTRTGAPGGALRRARRHHRPHVRGTTIQTYTAPNNHNLVAAALATRDTTFNMRPQLLSGDSSSSP